jgi:hypothetical protein
MSNVNIGFTRTAVLMLLHAFQFFVLSFFPLFFFALAVSAAFSCRMFLNVFLYYS